MNCNLIERVTDALFPVAPQNSSILLGLSGGLDSVVLLHLLFTLSPRFSWQISALHVHHGISSNANEWAEFCAKQCAEYKIPLNVERVNIEPLRRQHGIEAAARKLRQAAFFQQNCDFVALAQHADDQVETVLLQMFRGAGVKGLAAMPMLKASTSSAHPILRPLIGIPRSNLLQYAQQHELTWVEDESNRDESYPRNFVRHRLLPLLAEKFPAYRDTLSRSAQHFAESNELLDEMARQDAQGWKRDEPIKIALWKNLSVPRSKNLLRYVLHQLGTPMPQAVKLDEMLRQLCNAREDAAVCVSFGHWQVRRYQGKAYVITALPDFDRNLRVYWTGEISLDWPPLASKLIFEQQQGCGLSLARLNSAPLSVKLRQGGEVIRIHQYGPHRTLKNLLQEHGVPPWQRDRLPLLYCGDELVCVVGVAVSSDFQAAELEMGLVVH